MPDTKDTNPKDAIGIAKMPRSTVSAQVMGEVGVAMLEGALKYGRHNYRVAGVRASVYYDAMNRHMDAWWEGQDDDPESGLSHVTKAIAGLMVLRDSMLQGNWIDDRPPPVKDQGWVSRLNGLVKKLLGKYPNPAPPYTWQGRLSGDNERPDERTLYVAPQDPPAPGFSDSERRPPEALAISPRSNSPIGG